MIALFTVEDRFQITGRGCMLMPGLPTGPGAPVVRVGTAIQLRTPDGKVIDTHVRSLDAITRRQPPYEIIVPIVLPADVHKDDVPVGTEVFLVESG